LLWVDRASQSKLAPIIHVRHRDEVEAPITDWLLEAYEYSENRGASRAQEEVWCFRVFVATPFAGGASSAYR